MITEGRCIEGCQGKEEIGVGCESTKSIVAHCGIWYVPQAYNIFLLILGRVEPHTNCSILR